MWKSDISFMRLCASKEVHLFNEDKKITVMVPSARQLVTNSSIGFLYHFFSYTKEELQKIIPIDKESTYEIIFELILNPVWTNFQQTKAVRIEFEKAFMILLPDYKFMNRKLYVNEIEVTEELWKWFVYIWKFADNPKDLLAPDEENEVTLKQQEMQAKIKRMKQQNSEKNAGKNDMSLEKILLAITYVFHGLTPDILWDCTMCEIRQLRVFAQEGINYEIQRVALSTGNSKKKKLDFFLK